MIRRKLCRLDVLNINFRNVLKFFRGKRNASNWLWSQYLTNNKCHICVKEVLLRVKNLTVKGKTFQRNASRKMDSLVVSSYRKVYDTVMFVKVEI